MEKGNVDFKNAGKTLKMWEMFAYKMREMLVLKMWEMLTLKIRAMLVLKMWEM